MELRLLGTILIGIGAGVLSGMFGLGGGVVTTPAIRFFLGVPALVAVGTPLVAIIPSAVTAAISYVRQDLADVRGGAIIGVTGSGAAIAGAWATRLVGGRAVLVVTAGLILYTAFAMALQVVRPKSPGTQPAEETEAPVVSSANEAQETRWERASLPALLALGVLTGLYSGFLGLGGGLILVPLLVRALRYPMKRAIGTSLVSISVLAIPGVIAHSVLGNIDWTIALGLAIGVVPGAAAGARITLGASERAVRIGFSVMLGLVGVWLAVSELAGWTS
jgi:uncharacterized membrane protein YfcA